MTNQELADRRQRAREAGLDAYPSNGVAFDGPTGMLEAAIETATRVQITHEVVMAFIESPDDGPDDIAGPLRAAFRAAGFEVEQ